MINITAFDKAWNLVKARGFDIRDHKEDDNDENHNFDIMAEILGTDTGDSDATVEEYERLKGMFDEEPMSTGYTNPHYQGSHNDYIPLDEDGEPLSMEPMTWASAKDVLDRYEEETGIPCNSLTQIAPVEGGLADQISMNQLRRDSE